MNNYLIYKHYLFYITEKVNGETHHVLISRSLFYAGQRSSLPQVGYRPDAVFDNAGNYWGITFVELQADRFDVPIPAIIKFTFEEYHYSEVSVGATFSIMEGGHKVGTGKLLERTFKGAGQPTHDMR